MMITINIFLFEVTHSPSHCSTKRRDYCLRRGNWAEWTRLWAENGRPESGPRPEQVPSFPQFLISLSWCPTSVKTVEQAVSKDSTVSEFSQITAFRGEVPRGWVVRRPLEQPIFSTQEVPLLEKQQQAPFPQAPLTAEGQPGVSLELFAQWSSPPHLHEAK